MDKELRQVKDHFKEHYFDEATSTRIRNKVFEHMKKEKKKWSLSKKLIYLSSAVVIIIGLLVGSTFVSPAMAEVMSKVPYLNQILKSMDETEDRNAKLQDFYEKVSETLSNEKVYKGKIGVSMSWLFSSESPMMTVWVENKKYKQDHESEIKHVIKNIAQSYIVGDVKIEFEIQDKEKHEISKEEMESNEILEITQKVLEQKGYKHRSMGIEPKPRKVNIEVEMEGSDQQFNKVKGDIEKLVHNTIYSKKHLDYKVEVNRQSKAEKRDLSWDPIFTSVREEAHKKFNEVNGFAYSFHPMPLEIILKTSLSKGEESKKQAEKIEEYARQVIEIKRNELALEKIPYKIIIRDKKHDKLYEKLYE